MPDKHWKVSNAHNIVTRLRLPSMNKTDSETVYTSLYRSIIPVWVSRIFYLFLPDKTSSLVPFVPGCMSITSSKPEKCSIFHGWVFSFSLAVQHFVLLQSLLPPSSDFSLPLCSRFLSKPISFPLLLQLLDHLLAVGAVVVVEVAVALRQLGASVGKVAGKQQPVAGSDGERVAHEGEGVDDQGAGHGSGDPVCRKGREVSKPVHATFFFVLGWVLVFFLPPSSFSRISAVEASESYMSGLFCVSRTAAIGIPKLEAGPQKSVHVQKDQMLA